MLLRERGIEDDDNDCHNEVSELFGAADFRDYIRMLESEGPRILDRIRKKGNPE